MVFDDVICVLVPLHISHLLLGVHGSLIKGLFMMDLEKDTLL